LILSRSIVLPAQTEDVPFGRKEKRSPYESDKFGGLGISWNPAGKFLLLSAGAGRMAQSRLVPMWELGSCQIDIINNRDQFRGSSYGFNADTRRPSCRSWERSGQREIFFVLIRLLN
jgi:hypothetical protein